MLSADKRFVTWRLLLAVPLVVSAAIGTAYAAPPLLLDASSYKPDLAVVILQVNWGRAWKCNQYQNAQLQALTFRSIPLDPVEQKSVDLETPSKLFVDNLYLPYALVVAPGEYALTGFDVKAARSTTDVVHMRGTEENLFREGKPIGGTFTARPGEIVYVGHFGLDCGAEPFLWRFHIDGRKEFEGYVAGFRRAYPFLKDVPVHFRPLSTTLFGSPASLEDPVVK